MATLKQLLDTSHFTKLSELNIASSRTYHNKHLSKHQKKFNDLILRNNAPFVNPYNNLASFNIAQLTISGLFKHSASVVKARGEVGGVEGLKMPYFDFSICYRAGRDEPNAKNGRLI